MTSANTANKVTRRRVNSVSASAYNANAASVSDKDIKEVAGILASMHSDGYNYREIANAVSRTSGWVHNVIHGGRFTVKPSDVIAARSAYRILTTRKNRTRKHDESVQNIARLCIAILREVEELSN